MAPRGKFIAIEGIDGSGKRTQLDLLQQALAARGHSVYSTGFPQYDSWFGKMVGQFLNGDLGPLENVDPHFTALLYAGDRLEAKPKLEAALDNGQIVLVDRYIGSNLAHQTARVPPAKRSEFLQWIEHRYGFVVGPSVTDPARRPVTLDEHRAYRENVKALKDRLREIGFFDDLSDAVNVHRIRPRYAILRSEKT